MSSDESSSRGVVIPQSSRRWRSRLHSSSPKGRFVDTSVEPEGFIVRASVGIASTGSEQALIEIGKLMRLDESRFGRFIESTLNGCRGITARRLSEYDNSAPQHAMTELVNHDTEHRKLDPVLRRWLLVPASIAGARGKLAPLPRRAFYSLHCRRHPSAGSRGPCDGKSGGCVQVRDSGGEWPVSRGRGPCLRRHSCTGRRFCR